MNKRIKELVGQAKFMAEEPIMGDLEAVLREITETEDDIADLALSDQFRDELSRIRLDLKVSPFVQLTDDMCKWVILAYLRSSLGNLKS